jgi:hypothetical protein
MRSGPKLCSSPALGVSRSWHRDSCGGRHDRVAELYPADRDAAALMTALLHDCFRSIRYGILFSSRHCCEESAPLIRIAITNRLERSLRAKESP